MGDSKKLKFLLAQRSTEILKLDELKRVANQSLVDKTHHYDFKCQFKHIETMFDDFEEIHQGISALVSAHDQPDLEPHTSVYSICRSDFFHIKATYAQLFEDKIDTSLNHSSSTGSSSQSRHIRLPKIELPKFFGDLRTWQTFVDMFDSLIHHNDSLSDIDKFNYLLCSLEGPPLALVKRTPLTNQNYDIANHNLKKRYDVKRLIASSHWHAIERTKKLSSSDDAQALRTLLDTFSENTSILQNLGHKVGNWDFVLFNMLFDRLDSASATRFELEHGSSLTQDHYYTTLVDFILKQCEAMDTVHFSNNSQLKKASPFKPNSANSSPLYTHFKRNSSSSSALLVSSSTNSCQICKADHLIYSCPTFLMKTPNERLASIKEKRWCTNCLGCKHSNARCTSQTLCKKCSMKHHSLLHMDRPLVQNTPAPPNNQPVTSAGSRAPASENSSSNDNSSVTLFSRANSTVLLGTAVVKVLDGSGRYQIVRAILDSASQSNLISAKCVRRLDLACSPLHMAISGIGQTNSQSSLGVSCTLKPVKESEPRLSLDFVVLPKICGNMPSVGLSVDIAKNFAHLKLADPRFNISQPVDMLLGAGIFGSLLTGGVISGSIDEPVAMETVLGWVIMGCVGDSSPVVNRTSSYLSTTEISLNDQVKRFWELEQVPSITSISPEDKLAEEHFVETFTRTTSGRFKVYLPFRSVPPPFEGSRDIALRRFFTLERRLLFNPALYEQYIAFMRDYLDSHHMVPVPKDALGAPSYYIPHLCVLRPESSTTKIRVVFDASSRCINNVSLNDTLSTGPKLQQDLGTILLRFRLFPVAFSTDIKQMFRQILISEEHRDFQRILWRFSKLDPVQDFQLCTVTFGVRSSPHLAIRCLLQLGRDRKLQYPRASALLESDLYVDDIVSSFKSIEEALASQKELISLLKEGGMELRKWASNNPSLLSHLPVDHLQYSPLSLDFDDKSIIRILGLQWNPSQDAFSYKVSLTNKPCSKRTILSQLSRVFDPLGFLTPLTLYLKLLIQSLWAQGADWDSIPSDRIVKIWEQFMSEVGLLETIQIPRLILIGSYTYCELHGFCDASERAYAAVAYLEVIDIHNNSHISLISAESKVAPLAKISLPRLELCAALLLAGLLKFVQEALLPKISIDKVYAWTDSTVVLYWIQSSPHKWATFVANRVSRLQDKIEPSLWYHVRSPDNPADPASRGLMPSELLNCRLWWAGPKWLQSTPQAWPYDPRFECPETTEEQKNIVLTVHTENKSILYLLDSCSSLPKIQRIIGYISRFSFNCRNSTSRIGGSLTPSEMENALMLLIKNVQDQAFSDELSNLKDKRLLPKYLRKLTPFIDSQGILRVGGRLVHSSLPFEQKHPILLPGSHRLTQLIIEYTHSKYLHPGLQNLHNLLLQRYWILSPKRSIKTVISRCYKCFRVNPFSPQPVMGHLPAARISQIKPFSHTGIDMAGPFTTTLRKVRGAKSYKSYLCIFVCMATKAIHIELVSDLTADAFLAALRRFIARRGRCSHLYSDSGTNFIAASKYISSLMENVASEEQIQFHINCPKAPNFGGLWESGIKSIKYHLFRVIGDQILTFEELYTVLVQVESVLNSRPICPLSSDPHDLQALTPGHFLTLEPLNSVPDPDLSTLKLGRLSRWQLLVRMHQSFWDRWNREYLHTLMQRSKWTIPSTPIEPQTLVLLKDELSPPLKWHLGRVEEVFPGSDGIIRVVSVRTAKGTYRRPVHKVCPLPLS